MSVEDRLVMRRVVDVFRERLAANVATSCERALFAEIPFYGSLPKEVLQLSFQRAFEAMGKDLETGQALAFPQLLAAIGQQRAGVGVSITDILRGMGLGFEVVSEDFATHFADDPEARIYWETIRARVAYTGAAALADAYLAAREKVVRAQAEEIKTLSARVLPLYPGILVLPLVGALDAHQAEQITPLLLDAVPTNASRVVLIDVTGLASLGAEAAELLLGAARALELLGATPILVGVRANMARTMVDVGVDLGRLTTLADLASGLRHGLETLGMTITRKR